MSWSGDTTTTANPLSLVMTRNRTLTANFAINTYSVNLATTGSGTVTAAARSRRRESGDAFQTLCAQAAAASAEPTDGKQA